MSLFQQLSASLGQQHEQPQPPAPANNEHITFILVMHNKPPHLNTLPGELTSLIAYKSVGTTSIDTTLWHHCFGHPGGDAMTLALRSADIT
jgi:hypothetical protein